MSQIVNCSNCNQKLRIPTDFENLEIICPACKAKQMFPDVIKQSSSEKFSKPTKNPKKFIFDLDALNSGNQNEIRRVGENFHQLNQRQRDLIRHNVPSIIFEEIRLIHQNSLEAIKNTNNRSFESFDKAGERYKNLHESVNSSNMSREEKRDSRESFDRQHEREQQTIRENHSKTIDAVKLIANVAIVTGGLVGIGLAVGKLKKDI